MLFADVVAALRAGYTNYNIMVQITSQAVLDDMAAAHEEWDDYHTWPGYEYPYLSGSGYQTGNLVGHKGVLHIAQKRTVDGSTIYNGGIQRLTGLGDVFSGLLRGAPSSSGSLDYETDDSPLMLEVLDIDWTNDSFEARIDFNGSGWDGAHQLHFGTLSDATIRRKVMSWRVLGNHLKLREIITPVAWNGAEEYSTMSVNFPFGYVYAMPVLATAEKVGSDFVYGASNYEAYNPSFLVYESDPFGISTEPHTNYAADPNRKFYPHASSGWTVAVLAPENYVFADVSGYDEGAGFTSANTAAEIIETIMPLANLKDYDGNVSVALNEFTIDYASLTTFKSKCTYGAGVNVGGKDLSHSPSSTAEDVGIPYNYWEWGELFEALIGDSNGVYTINNDNSISFHFMQDAPDGSDLIAATIRRSDFSDFDIKKVVDYNFIELASKECNTHHYQSGGSAGAFSPEYEDDRDPRALHLTHSTLELGTTQDTAATDLLNRFGTYDYRFKNAPIALALNVGDVVSFTDDIDDFLDGTKKGYVTAVDRGTSPFIEVRA